VIPWNHDVIPWNRDVILWNHAVILVFAARFHCFSTVLSMTVCLARFVCREALWTVLRWHHAELMNRTREM
jgi:hypothetical protein